MGVELLRARASAPAGSGCAARETTNSGVNSRVLCGKTVVMYRVIPQIQFRIVGPGTIAARLTAVQSKDSTAWHVQFRVSLPTQKSRARGGRDLRVPLVPI